MNQRSKIGILGFGVEGKAMMEYLVNNGYSEITVCDKNVDIKDVLPQGVSARLGEHYLKNLEDFEVVFRSPGIAFLKSEIQAAKISGVEINSPTKFFMDQCPCPVIGVTGTKGKGTTSSLIYEMLQEDGWKAGVDLFLGGNIGNSPMEFLEKLKGDSLVVLELSSFQLQDLRKSPKYAVLLNTTTDHLDYHVDNEEYMKAKESLLAHQHGDGVTVLNKDYEYTKYYQPLVKGGLFLVSVKGALKSGAYVRDGGIYYAEKGEVHKIAEVSEVALIGSHNLENILPAVVIAKKLGVSEKAIHHVIKSFKNLPHRLQFVRELKGVRYFNDSYSTNGQTSIAAVDSFDEPMILIAGGYDKGLDCEQWARKILTKPNLHTVILLGQTADKMEKALLEAEDKYAMEIGSPTKIIRRKTLEQAVIESYAEAEEGGVVVMSPAAASFDMFKDYKERGNEFIAHVRKLK